MWDRISENIYSIFSLRLRLCFLRDVPISQLGFKYVDQRGSLFKSSDGSTYFEK